MHNNNAQKAQEFIPPNPPFETAFSRKPKDFISLLCALISLLLIISGLAIPYWGCGYIFHCIHIEEIRSEWRKIIFTISSIIFYILTSLMLLIYIFLFIKSYIKKLDLNLSKRKVIMIMAFIFNTIANSLFGISYRDIFFPQSLLILAIFFLTFASFFRLFKISTCFQKQKEIITIR